MEAAGRGREGGAGAEARRPAVLASAWYRADITRRQNPPSTERPDLQTWQKSRALLAPGAPNEPPRRLFNSNALQSLSELVWNTPAAFRNAHVGGAKKGVAGQPAPRPVDELALFPNGSLRAANRASHVAMRRCPKAC